MSELPGPAGPRAVIDADDEILFISPRDPNVVTPPTELQGPPLQSRFIFNPNQPWPPVLATRFFTPPPWPENLEGDNLTILPVVGPFLALTPEQMETPPGFGRFVPGLDFDAFRGRIHYGDWRGRSGFPARGRSGNPGRSGSERREERVEAREERMEDRENRRRRRRRGRSGAELREGAE